MVKFWPFDDLLSLQWGEWGLETGIRLFDGLPSLQRESSTICYEKMR